MEAAKIVLLSLAIFCGYGAVFGEVCAWICPEAYTLARGMEPGGASALLTGPLWGIFDFLIFAAGIGIGTALAAHVGNRPTVKAFFFRRPMLLILPMVALTGIATGIVSYYTTLHSDAPLDLMARAVPQEKLPAYAATWWAMIASQMAMLAGGVGLAIWTWRKRAYFEQLVRERGF